MPEREMSIRDRYEVVRPLGRGSFAETLLARDVIEDRLVAIKALHSKTVTDWKAYELFEREVATMRSLRHRGVPVVYESFRAHWNGSETSFLVMEYVEGDSLAGMIAERRDISTDDALHFFDEMLGVLDYLHSRVPPVLHRDIKPSNVIVRPDGSPVLVDFGAVRSVFRDAEDAGSTVAGTYGYMPYEQLMGQASPASDLYALAATFLHLMTGRTPPEFMGDAGRIEVPDSLPAGPAFAAVLRRMLAPAPSERFRTAREVRAALLGGAVARPPSALVSAGSGSAGLFAMSEGALAPLKLPPAPRPLAGEAQALVERNAHSMWRLMQGREKGSRKRWTIGEIGLTALFSVLTAGVLPLVFHITAKARRRQLEEFSIEGQPAVARVLVMTPEDLAFEVKVTRVRYEFEADGRVIRDSDWVLQSISDRWDVGSLIQVLYRPDQDYDSIIVSTS